MQAETSGTRERLLAAAAELFAAHGFRGATLRDISERAGANLASANYHFGSKESLYREVVFAHFAALEREFEARGLDPEEAKLERLGHAGLEALLRSRIELMLETLLLEPNLHATLMLRELCDPTDVLPEIVDRFVRPMRDAMERIIRHLAPELTPADAGRCVQSLVGQIFFYRSHRAALLLLEGSDAYPADFTRKAARHIARFTLGGLASVAEAAGGG